MKNKATLAIILALGVSACAAAQGNLVDRNFQRVDAESAKVVRSMSKSSGHPSYWQIAGAYSFPKSVEAKGGSLIYSDLTESGEKSFFSTSTYLHWTPSGGTEADQMSETLAYQFSSDSNWAITPGLGYSFINDGTEALTPFISATVYSISGWHLIPTVTYDHLNNNGIVSNGAVPDVMLLGTTPSLISGQPLVLFADWIVPTTVSGTGWVQVGGKHSLDSSGVFSVKGSAMFSNGSAPSFLAELAFKF